MATLDPRHSSILPNLSISNNISLRRATVSSPAPSFPFSNAFESHRPRSRNDRYFQRPYPIRRSTVSGHSQGHDVNSSPQLTARAEDTRMWSDSTSSSPLMNTIMLNGTSPAPSSSSGASPNVHATYDFSYAQLSPVNSSFTLGPSPDVPTTMGHPRSMPPPPQLSADFHTVIRSGTGTTTPALSPVPSTSSFTLDSNHNHTHLHLPDPSHDPAHDPLHSPPSHTLSRDELDELVWLRDRVRHLEFINDLVRLRVAELESSDSKAHIHADLGLADLATDGSSGSATTSTAATHNHSSHSTPAPAANLDLTSIGASFTFLPNLGPAPPDWDTRTAARLKRFCALNRAGNALCAWHDSRRERREYPPRMAPDRTLNCGCTHDEALFEESLTRNGVGAFHPGENVRMDPALRNPLLRLLEQRYGYRDGDFERTPEGGWKDGEDSKSWEQKAASSGRATRRVDREAR